MTYHFNAAFYVSTHGPNDQKLMIKSQKAIEELVKQVLEISRLIKK